MLTKAWNELKPSELLAMARHCGYAASQSTWDGNGVADLSAEVVNHMNGVAWIRRVALDHGTFPQRLQLQRGLRELNEGQGVPHDEVVARWRDRQGG